jgi:tight adherence protein C
MNTVMNTALNTLAPLDIALLCAAVVMLVAVAATVQLGLSRRRLNGRLDLVRQTALVVHGGGAVAAAPGPLERFGAVLAKGPLIGQAEMALIKGQLATAGFGKPGAAAYFVGLKAVLALTFVMSCWIWLEAKTVPASLLMTVGTLLASTLAGWRLPDLVLTRLAKRRREAIERGLPDALDLLVICGEAGLGLDIAFERVAREMKQAHPELGAELAITAAEMRVLPDRFLALANMADRLKLETLRSLVATLSQTMRYGTPLGQALRVLANEMRRDRLTRFEAKAARLPVLITLPMIGFILPCVFIVVAGPAALDLIHTLSSR